MNYAAVAKAPGRIEDPALPDSPATETASSLPKKYAKPTLTPQLLTVSWPDADKVAHLRADLPGAAEEFMAHSFTGFFRRAHVLLYGKHKNNVEFRKYVERAALKGPWVVHLRLPLEHGGTTRPSNMIVMDKADSERWKEDFAAQLAKPSRNNHERKVAVDASLYPILLPRLGDRLQLPMMNELGQIKYMELPLDRHSGEEWKHRGFPTLRKLIANHAHEEQKPRPPEDKNAAARMKRYIDALNLPEYKRASKPQAEKPPKRPVEKKKREKTVAVAITVAAPTPAPARYYTDIGAHFAAIAETITHWRDAQTFANEARRELDRQKTRLQAAMPDIQPKDKVKGKEIASEVSRFDRMFRKHGKRIEAAAKALKKWAKLQRRADTQRRKFAKQMAAIDPMLADIEARHGKIKLKFAHEKARFNRLSGTIERNKLSARDSSENRAKQILIHDAKQAEKMREAEKLRAAAQEAAQNNPPAAAAKLSPREALAHEREWDRAYRGPARPPHSLQPRTRWDIRRGRRQARAHAANTARPS